MEVRLPLNPHIKRLADILKSVAIRLKRKSKILTRNFTRKFLSSNKSKRTWKLHGKYNQITQSEIPMSTTLINFEYKSKKIHR